MLEVGVKREQGVIAAIKNNEYGFIRAVERPEQIYFRVDDIVDESSNLSEGMDVEFFVIAESVKGKLSDRAVHLSALPKGTAVFEITVAASVLGLVSKESTLSPDEKPGLIQLTAPIPKPSSDGGAEDVLTQIELWQRCLPEDLCLCVGDTIELDVQHYRPENLYFARSVKVKYYQPLSREYGTICSIKEHGFGFIRSYIRDMDLYFRTADVRDFVTGELIPESSLRVDQMLCFNVIFDDNSNVKGSNSGAPKLKAIRLQTAYKRIDSNDGSSATSSLIEMTSDDIKSIPLRAGIRGIVIKDAGYKRDAQPGQIKILPQYYDDIRDLLSEKTLGHSPESIASVKYFLDSPVLSELLVKHLTNGQRRAYHELFNDLFESIYHDTIELPKDSYHPSDPSKGSALLIRKQLNNEEKADNKVNRSRKTPNSQYYDDIVFFLKSDVDESMGPITKELEVSFQLCFDIRTMKKVAKDVLLTDDPIEESTELSSDGVHNVDRLCYGVIDSTVDVRSGSFGFIRRIPTHEKLYWHSSAFKKHLDASNSSAIPSTDLDFMSERQEVSFKLRRRGGMRCAVDITALSRKQLFQERIIEGSCVAVVVGSNRAVILHTKSCSEFERELWDISFLSITASADGAHEKADTTAVTDKRLEIKYFGPLPRESISIVRQSEDMSLKLEPIASGLLLGTIVSCRLVCNWALQRQPLRLIYDPSSTAIYGDAAPKVAVAERSQGIITRLRARGDTLFKGSDGWIHHVPENCCTLDFCEIRLLPSMSSNSLSGESWDATRAGGVAGLASDLYYCLYSELVVKIDPLAMSTSRDSVQVGDRVEFMRVSSYRLALHPTIIPKIQFRSQGEPKSAAIQKASKAPNSANIVVAKGPPQDLAVGFDEGWRVHPDTDTLPWGHLFHDHA